MLKTDISRVVEKKDTYLQILIRTDKNKTVFLGKLFTEGLFNETEDYDLAILQEIKNIPDHIFNLRANNSSAIIICDE
jgi:hypothetical protein